MRSTPIFCWSSVNQVALRGLEPPHFPILTTSSLPVLVPHTQRQALLLFLLSPMPCFSPSPWLLISNYVPWDFLHACVHGSSPLCYSGCCHRPTALPSSSHTLGTTFPSYLLTGAPAVSQWPPCPLLAPSVPLQCGWRDC